MNVTAEKLLDYARYRSAVRPSSKETTSPLELLCIEEDALSANRFLQDLPLKQREAFLAKARLHPGDYSVADVALKYGNSRQGIDRLANSIRSRLVQHLSD